MEAVGSQGGATSKTVYVSDCGELGADGNPLPKPDTFEDGSPELKPGVKGGNGGGGGGGGCTIL